MPKILHSAGIPKESRNKWPTDFFRLVTPLLFLPTAEVNDRTVSENAKK